MKKTTILVAMLFLSLVVSGCGKKTQEEGSSKQVQLGQEQVTEDQEGEEASEGELNASLKDLMGMGKNMKCSWDIEQAGEKTKGVIYVDGEKFREEISFIENGKPIDTIVISDGQWLYQWNSITKQGTKMKLDEMEKMNEESQGVSGDNPEVEGMVGDFNEQVNYKCENWKGEGVQFTPPSDIQFSDMTEMIKNVQENSVQMMQGMCQMCESLPSDAKVECLKSCQQ